MPIAINVSVPRRRNARWKTLMVLLKIRIVLVPGESPSSSSSSGDGPVSNGADGSFAGLGRDIAGKGLETEGSSASLTGCPFTKTEAPRLQ